MGLRLNAAIADSIITTTKEKTDKEISHDTTNALNTLSEIFDKKKIEEKQEYVNILSQVGYRLIGDIAGHKENELYKKAEKARKENNSILAEKYEKEAKKWSESGTNRIAMHGIMGALVSKEAGAGMTKGLTGAGLNALLQKELGKIKDPEVHKMASAAIGYLAGGKTGAAIAHQATTFNYLTHEQYEQYLDDMKNAKTEEQNRLLNMIQSQTLRQYELLSTYMKSLEQTKTREEYNRILSKVVVVGTYLKRWKNLILTRYSSQEDALTMEDLKQSLAESCESLKLCRIRAAYFVQDREKQLHADDVLKCYEFFEWLTEQLFDVVTSVFFRVTQIEEKLQISVHVVCVCQEDIRIYLAERSELLIQQEEEQEWFIRCPVS